MSALYTPLSALVLGEAIVDSFPAGVVNIVSGSDMAGAWITTAAVGRFGRSRGRSIESIGSVGSVILLIF